jgi:hypothetical protein
MKLGLKFSCSKVLDCCFYRALIRTESQTRWSKIWSKNKMWISLKHSSSVGSTSYKKNPYLISCYKVYIIEHRTKGKTIGKICFAFNRLFQNVSTDITKLSQQLMNFSNFKEAISNRRVMSQLIFWRVSKNEIPKYNNDSLC